MCVDPCQKIHTHVETCYSKAYTCGINEGDGAYVHAAASYTFEE